MNCDKIQVLLSKYADNEVSPSEREIVRTHITGCASCARRLAEFEQVGARFGSAPTLPPEPQLRVGLFRAINLIKEEERRKARRARENRRWYLPVADFTVGGRSRLRRLLSALNPVAVVVVFAFFGLMVLSNKPFPSPKPEITQDHYPPAVSTISAAVAVSNDSSAAIPLTSRGIPGTYLPTYSVSATMPPTGAGGGFVLLSDPTPVLEDFDTTGTPVHMVRDAVYGYSIQYPANWWTQVASGVRYFRPWKGGDATPYWIELRVEPNTQNDTAETYNRDRFEGNGTLISDGDNSPARLRSISSDDNNRYDDLFSFDRWHIYTLRLSVPKDATLPDFNKRWEEAQLIFSSMSGRTSLAPERPRSLGYGATLFLNGTDLYAVNMNGEAQAVARGADIHGVIRHFALSPDAGRAAFTSAKESTAAWGNYLYVSNLDGESPGAPTLLWSSAVEIHDVAWYSERVLLVIAKTPRDSGIYRVTLPPDIRQFDPNTMIQRITALSESMKGARSLAVAPDRQLITFLAPWGESKGTDIYAVRPDGSDLRRLMSHSLPVPPTDRDRGRLLLPEEQAIKSYAWLDGHLERDGYRYSLLFTCGNAVYPSFYRGGSLYAAPSETHLPLLDRAQLANLGISDLAKLEIVHIAYSTDGRVAITGYYTDFEEGRGVKLAGLWTADVVDGQLNNIESQPISTAPHGITDLQWSPDNTSLVYRETIPEGPDSMIDHYAGTLPFIMVKLDLQTGNRTTLYDGNLR